MSENTPADAVPLAELLGTVPPNQPRSLLKGEIVYPRGESVYIMLPEIDIWCGAKDCDRLMYFKPLSEVKWPLSTQSVNEMVITYICKHCEYTTKKFAILLDAAPRTEVTVQAVKIGEWPPFGPPIPSRVMELVGPDREWMLKAYRAERQGMGIGALAYYRRVVENQRTRILTEVIKVAKKTRSSVEITEVLEKAKLETQFSKSLELARDAIPASLLIDGHNPLRILHAATSEGIHALTDEASLENATAIRIVLFDLAQKIGEALKSEDGLRKSLNRLLGTSATEGSGAK